MKWLAAAIAAAGCAAVRVHPQHDRSPPTPVTGSAAVVWQPWEAVMTAVGAYSQPQVWWGLELNATFTHTPSGASYATPGFWDGGQVWKVRFAPPAAGQWRFTTAFTVANDTGLHGINGTFVASPYAGTNPLFRHGILRPDPGGRFFSHADGTPFYWLGDTHWSGFSTAEHWGDTNNRTVDPSVDSMLRQMVDVRAAQGYSVWKAETFVVNGQQQHHHHDHKKEDNDKGEEERPAAGAPPPPPTAAATTTTTDGGGSIANAGGPAWLDPGGGARGGPMFEQLNPAFWAAIDDVVAYVNSRGLVVSLAFAGIGRGLTEASMEKPITALARYSVARYSAYHTVWTTCQEYCAGTPFPDAWARIAQVQYNLDPHHRSTSLHNCVSNPLPAWRGEAWYGHVTLQQGHGITSPVDHWLEQYAAEPPRVLVEDEANYELLKYASMTTNIPPWLARQSAWQSQVGGATGFTYGGQGIWWACFNRTYVDGNCGPNDPPGPPPPGGSQFYTWDQALFFEVGGRQLPAMAAFFRRLPWHTLAPAAGAVAWGPGAPQGATHTQRPFQKADPARDYIVAYLPQADGDPSGGDRPVCRARPPYNATVALNAAVGAGAHRVAWFSPRSGEYTEVATVPAGTPHFAVPATRPGGDADGDWVLLVEPATAQPTAAAHNHGGRVSAGGDAVPGGGAGSARASVGAAAALAPTPTPTPTPAPTPSPPPLPPGTSWVTGVKVNSSHARGGAVVAGCSFTATQNMSVTHLCRLPPPGSLNVENVTVYDEAAAGGAVVAVAATDARAPAFQDARGFVCAPLLGALPTSTGTGEVVAMLVAGRDYVLSLNGNGCDDWYDDLLTRVDVVGGAAAHVVSVFGTPPHTTPGGGGSDHCYGPVNFYFQE